MCLSYLHVLNPFIGLVVNAVVQVASFRYISGLGLLRSVFLGFIIGFISISALEFYVFFALSASEMDFLSVFVTNSVMYASLGYVYFHFINLGETARRIRILRELYDSKEGLSMGEILERYNTKDIVEVRMNRLIKNGQVIYRDGRYYIGSSLMWLIAKVIVTMKLVLLGKKSEFH